MTRLFQATILSLCIISPAVAENQQNWQVQEADRYTACMIQTRSNPESAFDTANLWEGLGGGHPARHCALAALMEIGHYSQAAQGLEKLAQDVKAGAAFKAKVLSQSATAWIAAGDPEKARLNAEAALKLDPGNVQSLLTRARAYGLLEAYWDVIDSMNDIIEADPQNTQAYTLRGAAYRQVDALDLSLEDLNLALARNPNQPEARLERGIVHRLQGRKSAARTDWRHLIETNPTTEAARQAKINLHLLDSGLE